MAEQQAMSMPAKVKKGMVAAAVPAAPPFPVPPHLAQVDEPTLHHMQRALGEEAVQWYLEISGWRTVPCNHEATT